MLERESVWPYPCSSASMQACSHGMRTKMFTQWHGTCSLSCPHHWTSQPLAPSRTTGRGKHTKQGTHDTTAPRQKLCRLGWRWSEATVIDMAWHGSQPTSWHAALMPDLLCSISSWKTVGCLINCPVQFWKIGIEDVDYWLFSKSSIFIFEFKMHFEVNIGSGQLRQILFVLTGVSEVVLTRAGQ